MNWQNTIRKASTEEEIIQEIGMALGGKEGDEFDLNLDDFTWEFEIEFAGNIHTDYENTNVTLKLDDHDKTKGHLTFVLE